MTQTKLSTLSKSTHISAYQYFIRASLGFYALWIIVFFIARIIFLAYHKDKLTAIHNGELFESWIAGLPMDLSAITYLFIIPLVLYTMNFWIDIKIILKSFLKWYMLISLALVYTITFADVEIYANWGSKISVEALTYLAHPEEALASSQSSPLFSLFAGIVLCTYISWILYIKWLIPKFNWHIQSKTILSQLSRIIFLGVVLFGAVILIRGGLGLAPMGAGHAYHSKYPVLNHAATNASWNFLYSIQKASSEMPCQYYFMDEQVAIQRADILMHKNGKPDTTLLFNNSSPNVVLIVLEGWPNDVTEAFGGISNIAPFFDSLALEGLRFDNIYSSGDRTYKGVPAVLSSYPALPAGSIIQYIQKMEKLPCLANSFNSSGYDTHFIYGGDIEFKSLSSYITHCGYDHIISQDDFPELLAEGSKWGVHDHHVFERAVDDIDKLKPPFFSTILTLSSHEPYDVPIPIQFPGEDVAEQFKNSVYYADWSLKQFFTSIQSNSWFDNTVFVFTSDHGRPLPIKREAWEHETFKIPFMIYGKPLHKRLQGKVISSLGSQLDLAHTLLKQLKMDVHEYKWSQDLMHPKRPSFVLYSFESGIGSVNEHGAIIYDRIAQQILELEASELTPQQENQLINLKALLQVICGDFSEL